jgi:predicted MFS family arabinose efflux permease
MQLHHHNHPTESGHSESRKHTGGWLLSILLVAQLMVILDITAVNIAMPNIAKELGISGTNISWTITSYSLIFGSLLLLGGRAADLIGRRRMFVTGLGVFTVASLMSATAGSGAALFAARAGQGLGADTRHGKRRAGGSRAVRRLRASCRAAAPQDRAAR